MERSEQQFSPIDDGNCTAVFRYAAIDAKFKRVGVQVSSIEDADGVEVGCDKRIGPVVCDDLRVAKVLFEVPFPVARRVEAYRGAVGGFLLNGEDRSSWVPFDVSYFCLLKNNYYIKLIQKK